jgi:nitroreductase
MPDIGLFEAIYSVRSLRRLKPDPVPEELITRVLDAAIRAPSGGNAQNWAFVVVRDAGQRQNLGAIYRKVSFLGRLCDACTRAQSASCCTRRLFASKLQPPAERRHLRQMCHRSPECQ